MKFSIKITFLLFAVTSLFFAQNNYSWAASNEKVDDLIYTLSSHDKNVRESAVRELGNIGDTAARKALNVMKIARAVAQTEPRIESSFRE